MPGGGDALVAFDIAEDHPSWNIANRLLQGWGASDVVRTDFAKVEIDTARWLRLEADWHHGYPQPEQAFGYRSTTYEPGTYCNVCGAGLKQIAPFQLSGEPKWGRNGILQLNWVFDEYFTTPELWGHVFRPHGVKCRPVTSTNGVELRTVVQLAIEEEVSIITDDLLCESCPECRQVKYLPVVRGPFPAVKARPLAHIVKTHEYFGSGGSAYKGILVSQLLRRAMSSQNLRGASVRPAIDLSHPEQDSV